MNEVQGPPFIHRADGWRGIASAQREPPSNSAPHLQICLAIDAADPLEIHDDAFPPQQHRQPAISETPELGSELFEPFT